MSSLRIVSSWVALTLILAGCVLAGCGRGLGSPPSADSESHFLSFCAEACADGLRCLCGVCTRACDETDECEALGETAECVAPLPGEPAACLYTPVRKVCEQRCETSNDCASVGNGAVCDRSFCRQAPDATTECGATATPACAANERLHASQSDEGCLLLDCVPESGCQEPFRAATPCDGEATPRYWFNPSTARCEVKNLGTCASIGDSFETPEECWSSCAPDYAGTCIETWNADWETADVAPVAANNLRLEPATIRRDAALALVSGEHTATLTYPDRTQTTLTLSVTEAQAYHVTSTENPVGSFAGIGPFCWNTVAVEADIHLSSADGGLDEHWQRVRFTVNEWEAFAGSEIWVADQWRPARSVDRPIAGSYRPSVDADECVLGSTLSLSLVAGSMNGRVQHLMLGLPCSEVTETTGISNSTGNGTEPARLEIPTGPVWSTRLVAANAQFCAASSPNVRGRNEPADTFGASNLYADPKPEFRVAGEVADECRAALGSESGTDCEPESFLTIWAAECIAEFASGLLGWETELVLSPDGRVVWHVRNTLLDDGDTTSSGQELVIDAVTGEVGDLLESSRQP